MGSWLLRTLALAEGSTVSLRRIEESGLEFQCWTMEYVAITSSAAVMRSLGSYARHLRTRSTRALLYWSPLSSSSGAATLGCC